MGKTDTTILRANARPETGKGAARAVRREGRVPATLYGLGADPASISVDALELQHIIAGGVNSVISLEVDGSPVLTLCRQVQRHPVKNTLTHVDFVRVDADKPIGAEVTLELTGEAEGARMGGRFEQLIFSVAIEARPGDIPPSISHDISGLGLGDQLAVSGIAAPSGVSILNDPDQLVAQVAIPRGMVTAARNAAGEAGGEAEASEG